MSEAVKIPDFLKSLPAASSASGLSMMSVSSSGELSRIAPKNILSATYVAQGDVENLDEAIVPGIYSTGTATDSSKYPPGGTWAAGMLEVYKRGTLIYQRLTGSSGHMAARVRSSDAQGNQWGPWRVFQFS